MFIYNFSSNGQMMKEVPKRSVEVNGEYRKWNFQKYICTIYVSLNKLNIYISNISISQQIQFVIC